jgi:hypothetical protein
LKPDSENRRWKLRAAIFMRTGKTENGWNFLFQKCETLEGYLNLFFFFYNKDLKGSLKRLWEPELMIFTKKMWEPLNIGDNQEKFICTND